MKTLKDISKLSGSFFIAPFTGVNKITDYPTEKQLDFGFVYTQELKQEAIKQREYKFKMAINAPDRETKDFLLGQCAFIEEFFNLEDLK